MKVLVVAAHPDDEVLGCGGTIARMAREGHETYMAILGEGITSRYSRREEADPKLVEKLHSHIERAAKVLECKDLFTYSLPDNRFDTVPLLEVVKIVEELVSRLTPQIIYTHHGGDLNVDHGIVHRAVLTATRPMAGQPVREIHAFEIPSSTEWAFSSFPPTFIPNSFVEISGTFEEKVRALSCYESEVRVFPHPRSPEALQAIARRWGSAVGCELSEAFQVVRMIR